MKFYIPIMLALGVSQTHAASTDFHSKNDTPEQFEQFLRGMREITKDTTPDHGDGVVNEFKQRRSETIRETAFRHMVEICEEITSGDEKQNSKCNTAINYYRTVKDDPAALQ